MAALTTRLYIIRHAIAEDVSPEGDDFSRRLTRKGSRRFARLVKRLARAGMEVDAIATSPLVRTRETAEILSAGLPGRPPVVVVEALAAGLPVVISPACTGNLDLSQPFIHVVESDDQLIPAVQRAIAQRDELTDQIRAYAEQNFDYDSLVQRYLAQLQAWREVQ